jgi:hypothetical protein
MRKLMDRKISAQNGVCALCKAQFTDYSDIVPDLLNSTSERCTLRSFSVGVHTHMVIAKHEPAL